MPGDKISFFDSIHFKGWFILIRKKLWVAIIVFWKTIPECYRLVQSFPPEYFRQEIAFYVKLRIAGRYFLRQGLFYLGLCFMGTDSPAKQSCDV